MPGLLSAGAHLFSPLPFSLMLLGTFLGIVVGAIPGLTGAMLISLTLPLTFGMAPGNALILLVSMYIGSVSGGLISATLLRMPGTPASLVTTLDGYPLAQKGQPGRALGLGITASFVGGMISWAFLCLLARPMADLSTYLGNFDYFALVLMALALIASVSGRSLLLGILSGLLGILVAMPGTNPTTGEVRLTLGIAELNDGFKLLPVLIGLFAVSQAIKDILEGDTPIAGISPSLTGFFLSLHDWGKQGLNLVRSSVLGTLVGILPGVGANVGSLLAYSVARGFSREPDRFGEGAEEGIVASEAANNATVGGALIPLIALGIPGSVIDAILLGGLVMYGLQPGPLLFQNNPQIVYIILATALIANVCMFLLMLALVKPLALLSRMPRSLLTPVILVFCVVGSYALANRMFDVWVMLGFGLLGLIMERLHLPLAPFVIGVVLGPIAEENLSSGLLASRGSLWPLFTSPLALAFLVGALGLLAWPLWQRRQREHRQPHEPNEQPSSP
jgi:putative tricarboxylic transport membrane protein